MVQTHEFIQEHQIDCDGRRLETVDIVYDQGQWDEAQESVALMRRLMGPDDLAAKYTFWDAEETASKFLTPGAIGSITYEAGSLNAYRLVIGILKLALAKGLNLQCETPATSISRVNMSSDQRPAGDTQYPWSITTPRGMISADKVVLATNGYAAHLYPKLQGVIVPLRGFVTAQRPGKAMPHAGLPNTYSFIYKEGYEYMIPRPKGSRFAGDIVIGGGLTKTADEGLYEYGNTDDTELNNEVIEYLKHSTANFFGDNWGDDHPDGRIRRAWSGVMGFSGDGFPLVGPIPAVDGLYIAAAFQGHGMVNCFLCAKALAHILTEGKWDELDGWFPRAYRMSESRLSTKFLNKLHSPRTVKLGQPMDQTNGIEWRDHL
jgi:glycine/D-amino acid oxidase-like deaminating enzyme